MTAKIDALIQKVAANPNEQLKGTSNRIDNEVRKLRTQHSDKIAALEQIKTRDDPETKEKIKKVENEVRVAGKSASMALNNAATASANVRASEGNVTALGAKVDSQQSSLATVEQEVNTLNTRHIALDEQNTSRHNQQQTEINALHALMNNTLALSLDEDTTQVTGGGPYTEDFLLSLIDSNSAILPLFELHPKLTLGANITEYYVKGSVKTDITLELDWDASTSVIASSALTGSLTFTNGSAAVSASGGAFTTELADGDKIRLDADGTWVEVDSITDDDNLTLTANYTDTGGSGASSVQTDPSGEISVGDGIRSMGDAPNVHWFKVLAMSGGVITVENRHSYTIPTYSGTSNQVGTLPVSVAGVLNIEVVITGSTTFIADVTYYPICGKVATVTKTYTEV